MSDQQKDTLHPMVTATGDAPVYEMTWTETHYFHDTVEFFGTAEELEQAIARFDVDPFESIRNDADDVEYNVTAVVELAVPGGSATS